jgi:phosphate transport system substrate-binding protein
VAPLLKAWIDNFEQTQAGISINYDVVGSGEGIARFEAGRVDFGASDVFIPAPEAGKIKRGVVQVPSTAGMIVLAYNLPGVKGRPGCRRTFLSISSSARSGAGAILV